MRTDDPTRCVACGNLSYSVALLCGMVAFFVLAVQLFITILEFKLTTLAGFVLVPFALWNRRRFWPSAFSAMSSPPASS